MSSGNGGLDVLVDEVREVFIAMYHMACNLLETSGLMWAVGDALACDRSLSGAFDQVILVREWCGGCATYCGQRACLVGRASKGVLRRMCSKEGVHILTSTSKTLI
jgi:hypothetical protein